MPAIARALDELDPALWPGFVEEADLQRERLSPPSASPHRQRALGDHQLALAPLRG